MKQLTVVSGKGGTGKTSLVGAFAFLAEGKVLADCDVDAADLHLILEPEVVEEAEFKALKKAAIDPLKCTKCGRCVEHCRFNAIRDYSVDIIRCEGCGVCRLVCHEHAVRLCDSNAGRMFVSETRFGPLVHARLNPGEEASGKLVTLVRQRARAVAEEKGLGLVVVDGSPGIGCPVIASIGGADLALVVTEPTVSGMHDLKRILAVVKHFKVNAMVAVNKHDLNAGNTWRILDYCRKRRIPSATSIPYDSGFTAAIREGITMMEYARNDTTQKIEELWAQVLEHLA